jgi:hypothetical protein
MSTPGRQVLDLSGFPVVADSSVLDDVRHLLQRLWNLPRKPTRVPCPNPCSIMRANLAFIRDHKYFASLKTDGVRVFMLLGFVDTGEQEQEYCVLLDRAFHAHEVKVSCPPEYFQGSLFDGELVRCLDGTLQYTVFDVVSFKGYDCKTRPFSARQDLVSRAFEVDGICVDGLPCVVKMWYPLPALVRSYEEVAALANVPHDGLILMPELGALNPGMQRTMFKWKPPHKHTIDFMWNPSTEKLELSEDGVQGVDAKKRLGVDLGQSSFVFPDEPAVVECRCMYVADQEWYAFPLCIRDDKVQPNDLAVAELTLQNIVEAIRVEELE